MDEGRCLACAWEYIQVCHYHRKSFLKVKECTIDIHNEEWDKVLELMSSAYQNKRRERNGV